MNKRDKSQGAVPRDGHAKPLRHACSQKAGNPLTNQGNKRDQIGLSRFVTAHSERDERDRAPIGAVTPSRSRGRWGQEEGAALIRAGILSLYAEADRATGSLRRHLLRRAAIASRIAARQQVPA